MSKIKNIIAVLRKLWDFRRPTRQEVVLANGILAKQIHRKYQAKFDLELEQEKDRLADFWAGAIIPVDFRPVKVRIEKDFSTICVEWGPSDILRYHMILTHRFVSGKSAEEVTNYLIGSWAHVMKSGITAKLIEKCGLVASR